MYSHLAVFWIYVLTVYIKLRRARPLHVKQHLEETTLSKAWLILPDFIKRVWLDIDLYVHNLSKRYHSARNKKQV